MVQICWLYSQFSHFAGYILTQHICKGPNVVLEGMVQDTKKKLPVFDFLMETILPLGVYNRLFQGPFSVWLLYICEQFDVHYIQRPVGLHFYLSLISRFLLIALLGLKCGLFDSKTWAWENSNNFTCHFLFLTNNLTFCPQKITLQIMSVIQHIVSEELPWCLCEQYWWNARKVWLLLHFSWCLRPLKNKEADERQIMCTRIYTEKYETIQYI